VAVQLHSFLTSTLDVSRQLQAPAPLSPPKKTGTHWVGGLVRPQPVWMIWRKISCRCLASNTRSSLSRTRKVLMFWTVYIYLNVGTHCLWFKIQHLEHALYKSTSIYLVQATSLIPQFWSSWHLHVLHKTVLMRLSQSDVAHHVPRRPHFHYHKTCVHFNIISSCLFPAISWSTCIPFRTVIMMWGIAESLTVARAIQGHKRSTT
jgi:hypothetical protein